MKVSLLTALLPFFLYKNHKLMHPSLQYLLGFLETLDDGPDLSDAGFQQLLVDVQAGKVRIFKVGSWRNGADLRFLFFLSPVIQNNRLRQNLLMPSTRAWKR